MENKSLYAAAVKDLSEVFQESTMFRAQKLEDKIEQLEKIIINLVNRIEYLESKCQ